MARGLHLACAPFPFSKRSFPWFCTDTCLMIRFGRNRKVQSKKIIWRLKVLLIVSAPVWVPFLLFLLLLLLIVVPLCYLVVYLCIWFSWLTRGRDILFVYSDSPVWRDYMLSEMLPMVEGRAVVLNWSERSAWKWWSLRVLAFRLFAGTKAFNLLLVVFRP